MDKLYLKKLLKKVIKLTQKAAAMVKDAPFDVAQKQDPANVVTTSDLAVQRYLREKLTALLPSSRFYCEEEDLQETDGEFVWVIDPIDGTMNYTRGIDECAISVALLQNKEAVLGVVHTIFRGDTFSAVAGGGAALNGKPISVSQNSFEKGILCTAMSLYNKSLAADCDKIIYEAYMQCNDVRRFGSCAVELCYLAAGKCDLFFEMRVFPWDCAAGYLILKEAGGVLCGFNGEELTFDKPTLLVGANSTENYQKLNAIVLKHLDKIPYEE